MDKESLLSDIVIQLRFHEFLMVHFIEGIGNGLFPKKFKHFFSVAFTQDFVTFTGIMQ